MSDKAAARAKFEGVFAKIRDELLAHMKSEGLPDEAVEWYGKNLDYNVPGGKLNRGMSVVDSVRILRGRELTEDEYFKSALLGWCVELLQAFFLVSDDMMDQSVTRRGQPCWYRVPEIGNIAINDSFMLEAAIYHLLKVHFRKEKYYVHLLELFHETTYQTEFGQLIDLITAPEDHVDLNKFSLKKHSLIVIYKTAYYSFYLPVALALYMCHLTPADTTPLPPNDPFQISLDILIPLGEYFQIQDDYLDYSGTPEQIGKIGTDIIDNKCSWCINTALAVVNPEQRKFLDESYGRKDAAKEKAVKQLYNDIGIPKIYADYEEKVVSDLKAKIAAIPEPPAKVTSTDEPAALKREVFTAFLDKIYKRQK